MASSRSGGASLSDHDGANPMFEVRNARPGHPVRRCIRVTFAGRLPASVRLYGSTSGDPRMARLVQLRVVRGYLPDTTRFPSCLGFRANRTDFTGLGPGVLYQGLVASYPDSARQGILDPHGGWSSGESHGYEFVMRVENDNRGQGGRLGQDFLWATGAR